MCCSIVWVNRIYLIFWKMKYWKCVCIQFQGARLQCVCQITGEILKKGTTNWESDSDLRHSDWYGLFDLGVTEWRPGRSHRLVRHGKQHLLEGHQLLAFPAVQAFLWVPGKMHTTGAEWLSWSLRHLVVKCPYCARARHWANESVSGSAGVKENDEWVREWVIQRVNERMSQSEWFRELMREWVRVSDSECLSELMSEWVRVSDSESSWENESEWVIQRVHERMSQSEWFRECLSELMREWVRVNESESVLVS